MTSTVRPGEKRGRTHPSGDWVRRNGGPEEHVDAAEARTVARYRAWRGSRLG